MPDLANYPFTFDGTDLSTIAGVQVYNYEVNKLPIRDIKINKLARRNKSIITSAEYVQKDLNLFLEVCGGGRSDTEDLLGTLKSYLNTENAIVTVPQGGRDVNYTATMNEFNYGWDGTTALLEVVFIASDPIGVSNTIDTLFAGTITSASDSLSATVTGTFSTRPTITLTVDSVTGGTGGSMSVGNSDTQQAVTIMADFVAGDVIVIDVDSTSITINGSLTDFTGIFPDFDPGLQSLSYVDDFTTRSVSVTSDYYPRYL